MIKNQYVEGNYLITEYESGAILKVLQYDEPKEVISELPKNPLNELREENEQLKKQLEDTQKSMAEMMNLIAIQGLAPTK